MGWCSGTDSFDDAISIMEESGVELTKDIFKKMIISFENKDWDCQLDSQYSEYKQFQEALVELHPTWFDFDEEE